MEGAGYLTPIQIRGRKPIASYMTPVQMRGRKSSGDYAMRGREQEHRRSLPSELKVKKENNLKKYIKKYEWE